ncbi:MAG: rRNA pseudouridine synthase [Clostridiales bacterium]|nr:rRNA pseudouridine synthase [Clostridiales bacterium]
MRINKFLAECGVASRRNCDKLISEGLVTVNGKVCSLGQEINESEDVVVVDGKKINRVKKFSYYIMNKPKGYVCTVKDDKGRKTVMDLLPPSVDRVFPVGRLDYDSEGLLILTNDGDFCNRLIHPSSEIPKTYLVKIEGSLEDAQLAKLSKGVVIDGVKTKKCTIKIVDETKAFTKYHVTVTEGRNREIRKMFLTVGKEVKFLKRIKIGDLTMGSLDRGAVRKLTQDEIEYLKNL